MGPDRPIHLKIWESRLKEVRTAAEVDENLQRRLKTQVNVEGEGHGKFRVTMRNEHGTVIREQEKGGGKAWTGRVGFRRGG